MADEALITLEVADETTPTLVKINEATTKTAQQVAELERAFTQAQSRWVAAAGPMIQSSEQLALKLTGGATAAKAAAADQDTLVRSAIAETQALRRVGDELARTAQLRTVEANALKAAEGGYGGAEGFLKKYGDTTSAATEATSRHATGLSAITRHYGILTQAVPGASGAIGGFISVLQGGAPLLAFSAVALGLVIQKVSELRTLNTEVINTAGKDTIQIAQARATTMAQIAKLDADLLGNRVASLKAGTAVELAGIEATRRERIRAAEEQFRAHKGVLDTVEVRAAREKLLALEIDKADTDAALSRKKTAKELAVALEQYAKETAAAWAKAEQERLRVSEDTDRQIAQLARTASLEAAGASARASGSPRQGLAVGLAGQQAQIVDAFEAQQRALEKLVEEGKLTDADFFTHRQQLIDATNQRLAASLTDFEAKDREALAGIKASAADLFARIGPGFEDLQTKLSLAKTVQDSAKDFQTLANVLAVDDSTASAVAEAVRLLTSDLVAQGATIDQIAKVVPESLLNLSSLFRTATASTGALDDSFARIAETGPAALRSVNHELIGAGEYFANLINEAEGFRVKLLEIQRVGSLTPRSGMLDMAPVVPPASPGAGAVPEFALGGTVPGPVGRPQLILAHGGEKVTPAGRPAAAYTFNINGAGDPKAIARAIRRELEDLERRT